MGVRDLIGRFFSVDAAASGAMASGITIHTLTESGGKVAQSARRADKPVLPQRSRISRTSELTQELTPEVVANAITSASSGNIGKLQGLYIRMAASDARYSGFLKALYAGLLSNPLRVFPSKTKTPASREYAQIASDILFMFRHSDLVRKLARPYVTGVAIHEPRWTVAKGFDGKDRVLPYEIDLVPPTLYRIDMEKDSSTFGELMVVTDANTDGELVSNFPWGRLVVSTDGTEKGWLDYAGAARPCLFWFLVKSFNTKWWAEFNELYGEPSRVAYFDEAMSEGELDKLEEFLAAVGRARYAMFPMGTELDLSTPDIAGSIKTYDDIVGLANTEMAIAMLGQTQTSDGGEYGSYAKANIHMGIQYQILKMIALMIEETMDQLILSTVAFNIGPNIEPADLPKIRLVVPNPEEKEAKARVFKLAQGIGLPLPAQHVQDELGIPEPDEDDVILKAQQTAATGQPGAEGEDGEEGEKEDPRRDYDQEDGTRKTSRREAA